jgi:hypothetical protein
LASQYFHINPNLNEISEFVDVARFSSKILNPLTRTEEQPFGLGLSSSEDGENRRWKTGITLVIDRSGSMSETLSCGGRDKMSFAIEVAKQVFDAMEEDEQVSLFVFNDHIQPVSPLSPKSAIDRAELFAKLDAVTVAGNPDAARKFLSPYQQANRLYHRRVGSDALRDLADRRFRESHEILDVSDFGIGMSFSAEIVRELNRVHFQLHQRAGSAGDDG